MRNFMIAVVVLLWFLTTGVAQQPVIHQVPIQHSSWASGQQMYQEYCAACHGENATGGGPAAAASVVKPPDLTMLARRNGGKFSYNYVYTVLQFGKKPHGAAPGGSDMPVWLPLFTSLNNVDREAIAQQRMYNLARYLESMQAK